VVWCGKFAYGVDVARRKSEEDCMCLLGAESAYLSVLLSYLYSLCLHMIDLDCNICSEYMQLHDHLLSKFRSKFANVGIAFMGVYIVWCWEVLQYPLVDVSNANHVGLSW
jgi:hypothetical protein